MSGGSDAFVLETREGDAVPKMQGGYRIRTEGATWEDLPWLSAKSGIRVGAGRGPAWLASASAPSDGR